MDDEKIVDLYWLRSDRAIAETSVKYGAYCMKISMNILSSHQDSEENVNDTYLQAWNAMPPQRPSRLASFLGKISRNLALNRYKARHAEKRGAGELELSLDELGECVPDEASIEQRLSAEELSRGISEFLWRQSAEMRRVFVWRYFYCESVEELSARFGLTQSKVKSILFRARNKLRLYLESEDYL